MRSFRILDLVPRGRSPLGPFCSSFFQKLVWFICLSLLTASSGYASPLTAFFFDAGARSVDNDNDGGDDYILARFDVDLDEDVSSLVTVVATLYNQTDDAVATKQISYTVTGQEESYAELNLIPTPNIKGVYYLHLALSDKSDELYIDDIQYSPEPGSAPLAYFADVTVSSTASSIEAEFDVNIVQQMSCNIKIEAELMDSAGTTIASRTLDYNTFFGDADYKKLGFTPTVEDAYSVVLLAYPAGSGIATDSRLLKILWPPGTGAYFKTYSAMTFKDHIEVTFDADLDYNIAYEVAVEAVLYNSSSDVVGYSYISYLTNGSSKDEQKISLFPEQALGDSYYVELILYTDNYPAAYGYISDVSFAPCGVIVVKTNLAQATFVVSAGDSKRSGSGISWTWTDAPAGDYTVTYGNVPGYVTPSSEKQTLASGATITFNAVYNPGIKGDVNNDRVVRADDAILALRIAAETDMPSDYQKWAADMNDDGAIRINDVILILNVAAGLSAPNIYTVSGVSGQVTITLAEAHGLAGESVTVPLKMDNASILAGGDISIVYDSKVLRAVDVSPAKAGMPLLVSDLTEPGKVRIVFANAGKLNSRTIASIKFNIIADDVSP